jgi:hypothetical protein
MPKLIDYPRTSYTGAWELAEIVDDTGGKCAIDTAARKLNRKVSGSFKAIIGSAVKFGLMTSKRELLTTTTLFRRIKHAYDKAEELQFHREAFLTPPLFTQLCRKFRNRELPVQMLDVMLIREFGVEEINAQNVAKAFVDGCRMCGLLDERNIIADIDALSSARVPRRELASQAPALQAFAPSTPTVSNSSGTSPETDGGAHGNGAALGLFGHPAESFIQQASQERTKTDVSQDTVANLFGLTEDPDFDVEIPPSSSSFQAQGDVAAAAVSEHRPAPLSTPTLAAAPSPILPPAAIAPANGYQMQMSGPGVNTSLDITDEDDLAIAMALLEKIRRRLRAGT